MNSLSRRLYYSIKPLLPRQMQISLRQLIVRQKLPQCSQNWPIDKEASAPPKSWQGWPESKKFAFILTHDVDTETGQERCWDLMQLEKKYGFRSSFNFVPERYKTSCAIRLLLKENGFEIGVHGLFHDGMLYKSHKLFQHRAERINNYIKNWGAAGFRSPAMHHNLDWLHELNILYDSSTFDTDPFEPQSDGVKTIFPFYVPDKGKQKGYVELPYTLPQDFTLFILLQERNIDLWRRKLDWIARNGGMVLLNTHPDYMNYDGNIKFDEYSVELYEDLLKYVKMQYSDLYWHALPRQVGEWLSTLHARERVKDMWV